MPAASLELMRRFVDAFSRRDEAALLELLHPDAQFQSLIQELEGTFYGREGMRTYLANLFTSFPDFRIHVDAIREHTDATVVMVRVRATGRSGGVSLDFGDWLAMRARDGKADWWAFFRTEAEALHAARRAANGESDHCGVAGVRQRGGCSRVSHRRRPARTISSANIDLVRTIFTAWERGDFGSTDWAHPEIEYAIADGPAPGTWRGLAGMAQGSRHFLDPWEGYRAVAEEYRELDDERVLVLLRDFSGRGKASGVDLGAVPGKKASLFELRDGKVTRYVVWFDRARAFAELGLAPEGRRG